MYFLTLGDVQSLANEKYALPSHVAVVASRPLRLGVTCPDENTLKMAAACIAAATIPDADRMDGQSKSNICLSVFRTRMYALPDRKLSS